MTIGRYTYNAEKIKVYRFGENTELHIGSFCSIAEEVQVFLGGNHRVDWLTTYPFGHINEGVFGAFNGEGHPQSKGDVRIGNDVWIGNGAVIMSGVTIGDGAVIGARSLVTKDVPPYTIVAGNPAKIIRRRFPDHVIEKLLELKWWEWDDQKINENLHILCSPDWHPLWNL
jgi:acetyltransferase-like isoleucine patch superfamily enzyme